MRSELQLIANLHPGALELPANSIDRPHRLHAALEVMGHHGASMRFSNKSATLEELSKAHSSEFVESMSRQAESPQPVQLDPELVFSPEGFAAARAASGALIEAVERHERLSRHQLSIYLSRPGSHHAGPDYAMGFCLLNNLAVAARAALDAGAERVAILDFDAHHGNGTERIFWTDPRVFTVSIHQYPFFPGGGRFEDVGEGEGEGHNLNLPLPAGAAHLEAVEAMDLAISRIRAQRPDCLLLEAGFDAHRADWTSELSFEAHTYRDFGHKISALAQELDCPLIIELGGGYTVEAMQEGLEAFIKGVDHF